MLDPTAIRAVLLDIEGTTTPISFVLEVLFPYAADNVGRYLAAHYRDPKLQPDLRQLREKREKDGWQDPSAAPDEIGGLAAYARHLVAQDSKFSAWKSLQGEIWQEGYASGELRGQIFDDVPAALHRWREQGRRVYIYSSGSVLAQKLIFAHTRHGDLTPLLGGHFDTAVGPKSDPSSYRRIASAIKLDAAQILFISDSVRELDAAHSARLHVTLSVRPSNPAAPANEYDSVRSFDELPF